MTARTIAVPVPLLGDPGSEFERPDKACRYCDNQLRRSLFADSDPASVAARCGGQLDKEILRKSYG
ncbi:MAG TPA: hypothetical protein V6D08_12460 [Candidatus Obscuribacterales bacterium]